MPSNQEEPIFSILFAVKPSSTNPSKKLRSDTETESLGVYTGTGEFSVYVPAQPIEARELINDLLNAVQQPSLTMFSERREAPVVYALAVRTDQYNEIMQYDHQKGYLKPILLEPHEYSLIATYQERLDDRMEITMNKDFPVGIIQDTCKETLLERRLSIGRRPANPVIEKHEPLGEVNYSFNKSIIKAQQEELDDKTPSSPRSAR
ncbi:MAG TPA: hypothetical protein VHZ76_00020 [Gammaproteobacteria bacterium]|jgi:hypothetical protein|nr:hypothetical protein [Gammaproteobacteria bacterium]